MFQRLSSFSRYYLLANASIPKLRDYELDYGEGPKWNFGLDWDRAFAEHLRARDTVLWRNWLVNDTSWAGISSLIQSTPQNSVDLISIENFNDKHTSDIRGALKRLFSDACTAAFRKYKLLAPIDSQLGGIVIRPATDLLEMSAAALGITERQREDARQKFFDNTASSNAQGGTIPGVRNGRNQTIDGRARVFLAGSAWAGESFIFSSFSFQDVMSHEFIHVGGQPPKQSGPWFGPFRHDLAGFDGYNEILSACR
jgi:hypothetical protein